jgi:hypothetical protein
VVAGSNPVHPTKKGISATTKLWLSCLERENWELAHKFEQAKQLIAHERSEWADILCFCKTVMSGSPNAVR